MAKIIAKFDTVPVNTEIDPAGGYTLKLKDRPVYDDTQVFDEVVKEKTLPFDKDMLEFAFLSVLKTMALKVSRDCNPRRVGNYLKFTPTLRGKVKGMYSAYNPATCTSAIKVTSLSGLDKAVDTNFVSFVNSREGVQVTILRICTLGEQDAEGLSTITKGKPVICVGTNLQYLEGDRVEIHWTSADGTDVSTEVIPTESDIAHMTFAWPETMDELPDGTPLTWMFWTRGGIADSEPQENTKDATLVEGLPEPSVTKVATTGREGVMKGQAFEASGTNLGFSFAIDHVSVTWREGGVPRQATVVPVSATAEKISFAPCALFDGLPAESELEFEFSLGETVCRRVTKVLASDVPTEPTLTNAHSPGCDPMTVDLNEDVILDGTNLKGFERLVVHQEECPDPIELPTEGASATEDGAQLSLPGSIWEAIAAKVDPSVMPTRPITFEVITPRGSASISPTVS